MRSRFVVTVFGSTLFLAAGVALAASDAPAQAPANATAQEVSHVIFTDDGRIVRYHPTHDGELNNGSAPNNKARRSSNLTYHGGPIITSASETSLFWGPSSGYASDVFTHVGNFFGQFGTNPEYNTITQYYNGSGQYIQLHALGGTNRFDTSTPPSTVTDAAAQQEIIKNFQNGNLGTPNPATVYFLYLPNGVTSTMGGYASCTQYCGYHSNFSYNGVAVKYAVMPYPSCGGCQGNAQSGLSIEAASLTIVSGHEMREAATDALGTAWYDRQGNEADDKCAWQLFVDSGYQYQKEWSNEVSACVNTR